MLVEYPIYRRQNRKDPSSHLIYIINTSPGFRRIPVDSVIHPRDLNQIFIAYGGSSSFMNKLRCVTESIRGSGALRPCALISLFLVPLIFSQLDTKGYETSMGAGATTWCPRRLWIWQLCMSLYHPRRS